MQTNKALHDQTAPKEQSDQEPFLFAFSATVILVTGIKLTSSLIGGFHFRNSAL